MDGGAAGWSNGMPGPVLHWCCVGHSITTPDETLTLAAVCLVEWRDWVELMAERYPPLPADSALNVWEAELDRLITDVAYQQDGWDAWYATCEVALSWLLEKSGVPRERARQLVEDAIGGEFKSWAPPARRLIDEVAGRLAGSLPDG
jgi:hypothetical protein